MKKFLAALLVVVMVVSMIPATVFAATASDEECAVEKQFGTHSKAFCDAKGVKYTQYGETVAPKCGQDGYTMYVCDCGEYFADDIIDMPDHEHAVGAKPVSARVEPTCSAYGKAAFYTCKHCNEQYPEFESKEEAEAAAKLKDAPAGAIAKLAHTPMSGSFIGNDCTAKTQICAVCGEEWKIAKPNTTHNFNYSDPHAITKEPGTCAPGEATFKCQNEGCDVTDTVAVDFAGHKEENLLYKAEKAPKDCNSTGTKAYWYCDECDAKFYYNEDEEFVPATDADLVIKPEHQNVYVMDYRIPTCGEEGFITYKCYACNAKSWTVDYAAGRDHTTLAEVKAHNELAKKSDTDDIEPWYLEVIDAGCPDGVTYYWDCHNPICGSVEAYEAFVKAGIIVEAVAIDEDEIPCCGEELEWTDPATEGHTEFTVSVPAAFHPNYEEGYGYSYTLIFCTNPECTEKADALQGWQYVSEEEDGEAFLLNVSVLVKNGAIYEMTEAEQEKYTFVGVDRIREIKLKQVSDCKGYAHYYEHDESRNEPATCTAAGTEYYVCANSFCRDDKLLAVAKLGHTPDYYNELGKSDGYACGKSTYTYCLVCKNKVSSSKSTPKHVLDGEKLYTVEVPNCKQSAGDYYACKYCDKEVVDPATEKKYTYTNRYNSLEEAQAAHGYFGEGELTQTNERAGDCYTVGRVEYKCADCSKYFWVYDIANTGHHVAPEGTTYYEEATCLNGAGYVDYECDRCGKAVKGEAPLPHNLTKFAAKKATCTTAGNKEYYICSNECCGYEVENDITGEKEWIYIAYEKVPVPYIDENGLNRTRDEYVPYEDDEHLLAKKNHSYEQKGSAPVSCTTAGYTYWLCSNGCGSDYVADLVPATGHDKLSSTPVEIPADCVNAGAIFYLCANEWCTGDDGIACICELEDDEECTCEFGADDGIYTDEETGVVILPAMGHINAAGQTVVNSCMDTTKDRVCIRANCPLKAATSGTNKGKKVVPQDHDKVQKTFEATCENPAYILTTCANGCGKINEVTHLADALGHLFAWNERADLEFVNANDIEDMGEEFLKDAKTFKKTYGDKAIIAYTPATFEADGSITFKCADCENEITMAVKKVGIDFSIELDNAVVAGANNIYDVNGELAGYNFIDGDVLAVTINMSAFETNVWGFNFAVDYNATALNFLGYKFFADDVFANFVVNNTVVDDAEYEDVNNDGKDELISLIKDANGTVKVVAYTETAMDGTIYETKVSGTKKVVTLYFQVEALYVETIKGVDYVAGDEYAAFFVTGSAVDAKDDIETNGDLSINPIGLMMDTNNNGNANITDVQNCVKIIKGQADVEYLAACDINKDGAVNLTDLDLMNKALVGKVDAFEMYKALSWKTPEGFVAA